MAFETNYERSDDENGDDGDSDGDDTVLPKMCWPSKQKHTRTQTFNQNFSNKAHVVLDVWYG